MENFTRSLCNLQNIPAGLKSTNCWPLLSLSLWKEGVMGLALADDGRLPASLSSPPLIPQVPITTPATRQMRSHRQLQLASS